MAGGPFGVPRAQPRAKRVFLCKVVDSLSTVLASELKQEQPFAVRWLDLLEEIRSEVLSDTCGYRIYVQYCLEFSIDLLTR